MDFLEGKNFYLIGIKGAGMTALAGFLKNSGKEVIGSDVEERFFTDDILKKFKIKVYQKFSRENIKKNKDKIDFVVYSTGYNEDINEEIAFCKEEKIKLISYPQALGELTKKYYSIAVCGTHGKTTTTAMTALALRDYGVDIKAIIGSKIKQIDSNILFGSSNFFVFEADEYQDKLRFYYPDMVVLTSVDYDHPDFFKDFKAYKEVFKKFVKRIPEDGFLVCYGEDIDVVEVALESNCNLIFYGKFDSFSELQKIKEQFNDRRVEFVFVPEDLTIKVSGQHNLLNATASLAISQKLNLPISKIKDSLRNFEGTSRRFEFLGERKGALIYDDYAHHPREVEVTLKAFKERFPDREIICIFHPHTFSRTKALMSEFGKSFGDADEVVILDVFSSSRELGGDVSALDLVKEIKKHHKNAMHIGRMEDVFEIYKNQLGEEDLFITMGAGDVYKLGEWLIASDN